MADRKELPPEETLDPEDWESLRALGHQMVDDMIDYQRSVRGRPVWHHAPDEVKHHFDGPVPLDPQAPETVYKEFQEYVLPYPIGNAHPRFWGWVFGTGTVLGALAEMLAAAMNVGASGSLAYHSANYVENQVVDWFKEMLGFSDSASGLLTSGCSAANLIGLAVARNTKADFDLRRQGLSAAQPRMMLYASAEIHSSIQKAVELLGLGSNSLHKIATNSSFQMDLDALRTAINQDRGDGLQPFCVIGAAGTTNTGAIDDLQSLAGICQQEDLWFHVDGAFGAWAALAPEAKKLVAGMELADSLAFDLHKWMYMPYEIGCLLVQHEPNHRRAFSLTPAYLSHGQGDRGLSGTDLPWLSDYGFQLSRSFRALKAWMSLKEHGSQKYGRLIQQNIDQAQYLAELVQASSVLELAAPAPLNVVCLRYARPGLDEATLDHLNQRIVVEMQEQGRIVVSGTTIRGKQVLHLANCNHRSQRHDFDLLVDETVRIGDELSGYG